MRPVKPIAPQTPPVPAADEADRPPEVAQLLDRVAVLLHEGQARQALDLLGRSRLESPWLKNAQGVCFLRQGNPGAAVAVLRGLVLANGVGLRPEAPAVFKLNFAAALLASGNVGGGLRALADLGEAPHPAAERLRDAVRRWKQGLSLWQRINWYLGGEPDHPVVLDEATGEL